MTPPRAPGIPGQGLPPPRQRPASQPEGDEAEDVYRLILGVSRDVHALAGEVRTGKADTDEKISTIGKDVADLKARDKAHVAKLVGIVAAAVASVIGGQRALAPAAPAPQVTAVRSATDLALDECRPLRAGSYERAECFERVSRGPGQPR